MKDLLWKNMSLHTEVFNEWLKLRERFGFKNNTDFGRFLLGNVSKLRPHFTPENTLGNESQR